MKLEKFFQQLVDSSVEENQTFNIFTMNRIASGLAIAGIFSLLFVYASLYFLILPVMFIGAAYILNYGFYRCPSCENMLSTRDSLDEHKFCPNCGEILNKPLPGNVVRDYLPGALQLGAVLYFVLIVIMLLGLYGTHVNKKREEQVHASIVEMLRLDDDLSEVADAFEGRDYTDMHIGSSGQSEYTTYIFLHDVDASVSAVVVNYKEAVSVTVEWYDDDGRLLEETTLKR